MFASRKSLLKSWVGLGVASIFLGGLFAAGGCGIEFTTPRDLPNDGVMGAPEVVTVRFRNFSLEMAVNVQFHATNEVLAVLPDDLLVDANLISSMIGVAGTGIIQPLRFDVIEFECTGNLRIGTLGGVFLDNDTGEVLGMGTVRWIGEGQAGLCGSIVTFDFTGAEGEFTTQLRVGE